MWQNCRYVAEWHICGKMASRGRACEAVMPVVVSALPETGGGRSPLEEDEDDEKEEMDEGDRNEGGGGDAWKGAWGMIQGEEKEV